MKKTVLMMAICSCVILYFSCSLRNSIPYDPSREQFVKQLGMMYEKDIIDFFPLIVATDNIWWSYHKLCALVNSRIFQRRFLAPVAYGL